MRSLEPKPNRRFVCNSIIFLHSEQEMAFSAASVAFDDLSCTIGIMGLDRLDDIPMILEHGSAAGTTDRIAPRQSPHHLSVALTNGACLAVKMPPIHDAVKFFVQAVPLNLVALRLLELMLDHTRTFNVFLASLLHKHPDQIRLDEGANIENIAHERFIETANLCAAVARQNHESLTAQLV